MSRALSKKLLYQFSRPFPLKLMQKLSNQYFIFPFYHLVSNTPSPLVKHLFPVATVEQFMKDLDFLLNNFTPATFNEVLNLAKNKSFKGKPKFFLTFDDGFSECFHVVLPILKERNVPAAFFINPAFIGNRQLSHRQKVSLIIEHVKNDSSSRLYKEAEESIRMKFQYPEDLAGFVKKLTIADAPTIEKIAAVYRIDFKAALQQHKPYMDVPQLRALIEAGFIIGSHSNEHPEFNLLSEDEMKVQVIRSFQFLSRELGISNRIFSFPFHDIGVPLSFFHFLQTEAGVKASFGTSGIKHDNAPGHIQRIPLELHGFNSAESIIRSEYFYYLAKTLFGKNYVKRR